MYPCFYGGILIILSAFKSGKSIAGILKLEMQEN